MTGDFRLASNVRTRILVESHVECGFKRKFRSKQDRSEQSDRVSMVSSSPVERPAKDERAEFEFPMMFERMMPTSRIRARLLKFEN